MDYHIISASNGPLSTLTLPSLNIKRRRHRHPQLQERMTAGCANALEIRSDEDEAIRAISETIPCLKDTAERNLEPHCKQNVATETASSYLLLSPRITVTAQTTGLQDDQNRLWLAVEVSGQLSGLSSWDSLSSEEALDSSKGAFVEGCTDQVFQHGCLYDLTVEVLPVSGSSINQILKKQTFPTTLSAGSSILLLVEVILDNKKKPYDAGNQHFRRTSQDLIEELEEELGNVQVEYAQVRVSYSHSAIPEISSLDLLNGVSNMRTRLKTCASATLKRHNSLSLWSPQPAPVPNPLFHLVEYHWGGEKASAVLQDILAERSTPRKPARAGLNQQAAKSTPNSHKHVVVVPTRRASLGKAGDVNVLSHDCTSLPTLQRASTIANKPVLVPHGPGIVGLTRPISELGMMRSKFRQTSSTFRRIDLTSRWTSMSGSSPDSAKSDRSLTSCNETLSTSQAIQEAKEKPANVFWDWGKWF